MTSRYAIAIGVRKSGQLPRLEGAIADARAFAEWASAPGRDYIVTLVTDEKDAVTIDRLKGEITTILDEDVSRLLIFYSGHGICSQAGDYWLLSDYDRDSDEAVNLSQSMRNARRLGIGQIAVFSDACRSSLSTAALISGRAIFPVPSATRKARMTSPYDEFLSADIGDAAQEVPDEDPAKSYGVFSRCLLAALHCLEPDAAESRAQRKVISSVALANWLEKTVPFQSGKIPGGAVQRPSITPSWRAPNDEYAEFPGDSDPATVLEGISETGRRVLGGIPEGENLSLTERRARRAKAQARVAQGEADREKQVRERAQAFQAQRGRESFETRQGLTIVGSAITDIVVPRGTQVDLFEEAGLWHVRGHGRPHSAALRTDQNLWIAATLLPEFIGTLVVGKGGVESVNYAPPRGSPEREMNIRSEKIVAEWNALLSVNRRANPLELKAFADEARQMKHINPAFGVLAAYAYERSGQIDEVASIGWYFAHRNYFVPFDVIFLLSAYGDPEAMIRVHGWAPEKIVVAGGFPMLTRGWALLDPDSRAWPELVRLRTGLMDSVWTTFNAEVGNHFAGMIAQEEI
jgi:hypothetical protein